MEDGSLIWDKETGLSVDFSFARQQPDLSQNRAMCEAALQAMSELEAGAIANPDEGRMVGHYWLRDSSLAPTAQIRAEIDAAVAQVQSFAREVRESGRFGGAIVIGIGGSSLGAKFVSEALWSEAADFDLYFIDNTDPDGIDRVFAEIGDNLANMLVIVVSKSGGTVETQNGMAEVMAHFAARGLSFYRQAVRITQRGSEFDRAELAKPWLAAFPMWEWVGGRTSVLSAVGLLPLALRGVDTKELLAGAASCDRLGRLSPEENPALLLALFWYQQTRGQGGSLMAVLPYKDRLELLAKYLQQLVMESLGKELDLDGEKVQQGLAVLGNKGSTDQHSYVQQLVAGPDNAFVVFVEVLRDRVGKSAKLRDNSSSGDYLQAFLLGTAKALCDHGKSSAIITVPEVSPFYVGMLIALFERAVGIYSNFVGINAYHQPAVEHGKRAAADFIAVKNRLLEQLAAHSGEALSSGELAAAVAGDEAAAWHILRHLAANDEIEEIDGKYMLK